MNDKTSTENQPVLTPQEARSGFIRGRVITVLVASMLLAFLLVGGVTLIWAQTH